MDLIKEFDRVGLGDILKILVEEQIPSNIRKVKHILNTEHYLRIKAGGHTTGDIPIPDGNRQRNGFSPFFFI